MSEYNFITKFVNYCNNNNLKAVQPMGKNQSTYADCEMILNNEILKIETKLLKNVHSNSVHFYNLIGELIGTSGKNSLLNKSEYKNNKTSVNILLPTKSKSIFDKLRQKNITKVNGIKYCYNFNIRNLIAFDENSLHMQIYYCPVRNQWV